MANEKKYATYTNFLGMNDSASPDNLEDVECRLIENCDLSERGGITMRPGVDLVMDMGIAAPIETIIEFRKRDGTIHMLLGIQDKLIKLDGTVVTAGLANVKFDHVIYNDKLYLVNGVGYYVYDGTTFAAVVPKAGVTGNTLDEVKRCKYMVIKNERILFAGDATNPNAVYYSEVGAPDAVPAINFIGAMSGDDDYITGLGVFKGNVIVHKQRKMYQLDWVSIKDDLTVREIDTHAGALSHRSIVKAMDKEYFLGVDGVYHLFHPMVAEQISSRKISSSIQSTFNTLTNKGKSFGVFHDNKLLFFCEGNAGATKAMVYHTGAASDKGGGVQPWTLYTNIPATCAKVTWGEELYIGTSDGRVLKLTKGAYTDVGDKIPVKIISKLYDMERPFHMKKVKRLYVSGQQNMEKNTDIKITCRVDESESDIVVATYLDANLVYGEGVWGAGAWGWADVVSTMVPINLKGKRVAVTLENFAAGNPFTVYGLMFEYKEKKPARRSRHAITG